MSRASAAATRTASAWMSRAWERMRLNLEALESSERHYEVVGSRATTEFMADMVALVGGRNRLLQPAHC